MPVYYFLKFCQFVVNRLPSSFCYFLANRVGDILYGIWSRGRKSMLQNVALVLGDQANDKVAVNITKQVMRNFCKYCVDFLRFSGSKTKITKEKVIICGLENIDLALREGKGAILVSFHIGNWDLGVKALSRLGYRLSVIVETFKLKHLDEFAVKLRANLGVKVIATKEGITKMVEVLRRNELLALLIDHNKHKNGVEVRFGDRSATIPSGAATLALRTGAKVLPCGLVRLSNNTFYAFIGERIKFYPSGNLKKDIKEFTQHIVNALERRVRQFVDQWYMFQPLAR